jgi:hypothetical protein
MLTRRPTFHRFGTLLTAGLLLMASLPAAAQEGGAPVLPALTD